MENTCSSYRFCYFVANGTYDISCYAQNRRRACNVCIIKFELEDGMIADAKRSEALRAEGEQAAAKLLEDDMLRTKTYSLGEHKHD